MSVTETYEYDYLGNRTSKTTGDVTTEYVTDLSSGYSQVLKATNGTDTVYYTRGFELISRHEGDASSYYLYDGGLSVRALTDEAGAVTDTLVFDAFGNEMEKTGTTANSYGFQGEEKDATGLYYLRARYMDPASGTFTSMDTYAGSLSDPMSLHKYLFANSNPVMYSDPSGHMSKLAEQVVTIGIMATLGAEMNGILYVFKLEDNNTYLSKNDFFSGLFDSMFLGVLGGVISGLVTIALAAIVGTVITAIILGSVGLVMSAREILQGIADYNQGAKKSGAIEIIYGVVGTILSGLSIYNGVRIVNAKANVGLKPNDSPSDYARSQQGTGDYTGVDSYSDGIVKKGQIVYRGEPKGSGFFTTADAIESSGGSATKLFKGLQVMKHPKHGYRTRMVGYYSNKNLSSANGYARANPIYGKGGLPQIYIPNANELIANGTLKPVKTIPLH